MEVGTSLTITLHKGNAQDKPVTYRSKVIDRTEEYLYIDYPVNPRDYVQLPIRPKDRLTIEYVSKGSVNSFTTTVKQIIESSLIAFVIPVPKEEEIKRIQRREYVRVLVDLDTAIHSLDGSFEPFTTITRDISGGGMLIITPKHVELAEGTMVEVYLVLKSKTTDYKYIKTKAEVIRTTLENDITFTSFKYHFADERERQQVIEFCFTVQREELKRQIY